MKALSSPFRFPTAFSSQEATFPPGSGTISMPPPGFSYCSSPTGCSSWRASPFFGPKVKTDVLAGLRSPEGYIFADDGGPADISLRERARLLDRRLHRKTGTADVQKYPLRPAAQPWRRVVATQDPHPGRSPGLCPRASSGIQKGYDRLTNGLALKEFIGYQHFSLNRRINFFRRL